MTLTARETMQALLDGKTLRYNRCGMDVRYKLDDKGNLLQTHGCSYVELRSWTLSGVEVYEEYPLTFEQALREMLDGRIVMCESIDEHAYRFRNGMFEGSTKWDRFTDWVSCSIFTDVQRAKWKVVECL